MAITSAGYQSPAVGREGLVPSVHDQVILIGATDTPILSHIGSSSVTGTSHSWLTDPMPDPVNTPAQELTSFSGLTKATKQKTSNSVQYTITDVGVSNIAKRLKTYGGNELAWELAKQAKAHAMKLEYQILGLGRDASAKVSVFKAPVTMNDTTAGEMAGLFYYGAKGATTFSAGKRGNVIAMDSAGDWSGTTVALTWDKLMTILQPIYDAGETPKTLFVGAALKHAINGFVLQYGTRMVNNGDSSYAPIVTKLDTDFGSIDIKMHRFLSTKYGLADTLVAGNFDYVKSGLLIPTTLDNVNTDKTMEAKRYETASTLEVRNADAISFGVGLKS